VGQVVAGVEHDKDVRITGSPLPGLDEALDHRTDLDGGDLGDVVVRAEPDRVQDRRPRGAPGFQRGDERVRPARNVLVGVTATAVDVTEQPVWTGRCVRCNCNGPVSIPARG